MRAFLYNKNDLGKLMMLIGVLTFIPTVVILFYINEWRYFFSFFIPASASFVLGFAVCIFVKNRLVEDNYNYTIKRGSLTVLFAWIYGIFIGAIPFLFLGNLNFIQCLFESASGWTTAGFMVMSVIEAPHIFIFHRSFMQFCGGLGFILMMVMIMQNRYSMNFYNFEGHNDQLRPSVIKTARTIFLLYSGIFVFGVLLYVICGMPVFDSIIHCMSSLSTGGFSTKPGGIADYNSIPIESVTVLIMMLGMTNFSVLLLLFKRKFKQAGKVSEIKFLGVLLAVIIPLVVIAFCYGLSLSFSDGIRQGIFNVVSVLSTTGFSTIDYTVFPAFALGLFIVVMFIGGSVGSTAGGIKLNRTYLLFRGAGISIKKRLSPGNRVLSPHFYRAQGKAEIDSTLLKDTYVYAFLYFLTFFTTALLLCLTENVNLSDAIFEAASLSGTVGVSIGIFGPSANAWTLIIGIIGMIIARLELNIIVTGVCSIFVRKPKSRKC